MSSKELQTLFNNKNDNEKYDLVLKRMIKQDNLWFLDKEGELVFYTNEERKNFAPLWSDEELALSNPPTNSNIKAVEMDVETFLLQFTVFLFNSQTQLVISPTPNDEQMIIQNALAFARDLIEVIRVEQSEEKALYYLGELKKIIKM
ncbi:DUF2750 domain-containing protein [Lonepinella koalarum]|uniref:Uncharacterized protein DUF2750 n=1 Tax=Lonepinella koalarum TaxID=53417 RepID=A0A4R1KRD4_9PAST|nr:DUF2750 domain-containing protein [Lonepinella koalarum]MDH2925717.1 hypothetical protein [Lonepinella koalarum]TCK67083.1 uncharacterized protein DUF2750 [Lonepinella koalarum]TFJ88926.1 DUF2750 domain-containing protein [Lonepinella koalarum]